MLINVVPLKILYHVYKLTMSEIKQTNEQGIIINNKNSQLQKWKQVIPNSFQVKKYGLINLYGFQLGERGINDLRHMNKQLDFQNIRHLNLGSNQIDIKCLKILCKIQMKNLQVLMLGSNGFGSEGVRIMSQFSNWPQLQHINLQNNKIIQVSYVKNAKWPKIISISLQDNLNLSFFDVAQAACKMNHNAKPVFYIHKRISQINQMIKTIPNIKITPKI